MTDRDVSADEPEARARRQPTPGSTSPHGVRVTHDALDETLGAGIPAIRTPGGEPSGDRFAESEEG
jgi:hypothetical protein